jgi:hypothetical protein
MRNLMTQSTIAPQATASEKLSLLRASLEAAGWSARVVKLTADERAERISDYALEG